MLTKTVEVRVLDCHNARSPSRANLQSDRFTILAGANCRKHLLQPLPHCDFSLEGLMSGHQLQLLKQGMAHV